MDVSREEFARLLQLYAFPDFVKKADMNNMLNGDPATTAYADPVNKMFPVHTAAATFTSAVYFHEKKASLRPKDRERIQQRLEGHVGYFCIWPHYQEIIKQAEENKRASEDLPDSSYAYLYRCKDGSVEKFLPMRSADEVKAASDWLAQYRGSLPFSNRNTIANKILDKAAEFDADLGADETDQLMKQAGDGLCDPTEVYEMILQRAHLFKEAGHREKFESLAESVKTNPERFMERENRVKLAGVIDKADRALGIRQYSDRIKRPEDVLFSIFASKVAADSEGLCALTTGNVYHADQFTKLSRDDVEAVLGSDFADQVSTPYGVDAEKMASIAHTLPRPDAEDLDRLMLAAGESPQMSKAAQDAYGMTDEQLAALSYTYTVGNE